MASIYRTWADGDAFTAADAGTYFMRQANISVANNTDRDAILTPQAGMRVYNVAELAFETYNGTSWVQDWTEIGRKTLTVASDTISIPSFIAKKYLKVTVTVTPTGGNLDTTLKFNNDTGANYAWEYSSQNSVPVNMPSAGVIPLDSSTTTFYQSFVLDITNFSTMQKLVRCTGTFTTGTGAGSPVGLFEIAAKWANNAQVTRIDVNNAGTGDFAIGSEIVVEGKN